MKVTGPGAGGPADPTSGVGEAQAPAGKDFAGKIDQGAEVGAAAGGEAAEAPRGAFADIGADLHAGRITAATALERVIDRVVERQVGVNAPAAVKEQVGAALRRALEEDPVLADKIRALGG